MSAIPIPVSTSTALALPSMRNELTCPGSPTRCTPCPRAWIANHAFACVMVSPPPSCGDVLELQRVDDLGRQHRAARRERSHDQERGLVLLGAGSRDAVLDDANVIVALEALADGPEDADVRVHA